MAEGDHDLAERKRIGAAQRALRLAGGFTLEETGRRMGMSAQGYRRFETGEAHSVHQPSVQTRMARAVERTREELLMRAAAGDVLPAANTGHLRDATNWDAPRRDDDRVPLAGRLEAGVWSPVDDLADAAARPSGLQRDPKYPRADQFARVYSGDSMNLAGLFDGDVAHIVATAEISYWPLDDHFVEVVRLRETEDGVVRERQIRVVQVTRDGVLLWAKSSNPKWRDPLFLAPGSQEPQPDGRAYITGLVLATHRKLT